MSCFSGIQSAISRWMWPESQIDTAHWRLEDVKVVISAATDDEISKERTVSLARIASKGWGFFSQVVNAVGLVRFGFNLHKIPAGVPSQNGCFKRAEYFPYYQPPTFNFSTFAPISQKIFTPHRGDANAGFVIDNGTPSIYQLLVQMLGDNTITPDDIIFTSGHHAMFPGKTHLHKLFTPINVQQHRKTIYECACRLVEPLASTHLGGLQVQIDELSHAFTCNVMSRLLFGKFDDNGELQQSTACFFEYISRGFRGEPTENLQVQKQVNTFWKLIDDAITERRGIVGELSQDETFTEKKLKMFIFSLLFAGVDSTRSSLTYGIFEIAKNPQLQQDVRAQITDSQLDNLNDSFVDVACRLPFLKQIIIEALRMFPPVIGVTRIASVPLIIKIIHSGQALSFFIKKGEHLAPAPHLVARDPRLFPDRPNVFEPKRHSVADLPKFLPNLPFSPFGGGAHSCPGAMLYQEMAMIFYATLIQQFSLSTDIKEVEQQGHFINKLNVPVLVNVSQP